MNLSVTEVAKRAEVPVSFVLRETGKSNLIGWGKGASKQYSATAVEEWMKRRAWAIDEEQRRQRKRLIQNTQQTFRF